MSYEYSLRGRFPYADVESETVAKAAIVLGLPLTVSRDGAPQVSSDGLTVYASEPEDADETAEVAERLGFEWNVSVIFSLWNRSDPARAVRVEQDMLRVVVSFADRPDVRAVLLADDELIVLKIEDGHVVMNDGWNGGSAWPEVLTAVAGTYTSENLSPGR